jgi:hypothetical protein
LSCGDAVSSTVPGVTAPDATGPSRATIGPHHAPRHPGQVARRVLVRRNIVTDAQTAQPAAAVQAALQTGAPFPARRAGARMFPPPVASRCSENGTSPGRGGKAPSVHYSILVNLWLS